jgi:hypothetical protein
MQQDAVLFWCAAECRHDALLTRGRDLGVCLLLDLLPLVLPSTSTSVYLQVFRPFCLASGARPLVRSIVIWLLSTTLSVAR